MSGDKVANQSEYGHDDVFSHGDDIRSGDFGYSNPSVGLVSSVEVDMIRADSSSDGDLEFLSLGQSFGGEVSRVEGSGDNDLGVYEFLVEFGSLSVLVGGRDQGMALALQPLSDSELVLRRSQETRLLLRVFPALKA